MRIVWLAGLLSAVLIVQVCEAQNDHTEQDEGEGDGDQQGTLAPWTGTARPWTGTARAWTGTENPYEGPVHQETDPPEKPSSTSTPAPQREHCYSFHCVGEYDECFRRHGRSYVCSRHGQYCKVSVHKHSNGSYTVSASCVANDCHMTQRRDITSDCCATHLCNDQHLLTLEESAACPVLPPLSIPTITGTTLLILIALIGPLCHL